MYKKSHLVPHLGLWPFCRLADNAELKNAKWGDSQSFEASCRQLGIIRHTAEARKHDLASYESIISARSNSSPVSPTLSAVADIRSLHRRLRAMVAGQGLQASNASSPAGGASTIGPSVSSSRHQIATRFDRRRRASGKAPIQRPPTACGRGRLRLWPVSQRAPRLTTGTPTEAMPFRPDHPGAWLSICAITAVWPKAPGRDIIGICASSFGS